MPANKRTTAPVKSANEALYVNVAFRIDPKIPDATARETMEKWLRAQPLPKGVEIEPIELNRWQLPDED